MTHQELLKGPQGTHTMLVILSCSDTFRFMCQGCEIFLKGSLSFVVLRVFYIKPQTSIRVILIHTTYCKQFPWELLSIRE